MILVSLPHPVELSYVVRDGRTVTGRKLVLIQNVLNASDCVVQASHVKLALVPGLDKLPQLLLGMIQMLPIVVGKMPHSIRAVKIRVNPIYQGGYRTGVVASPAFKLRTHCRSAYQEKAGENTHGQKTAHKFHLHLGDAIDG
jgi:hypothetical protein